MYGCVICGKPIYEYHHIKGFQAAVGHKESEITILCDSCHRKVTNGSISHDTVKSKDARPFNRDHSATDTIWMHCGGSCEVVLGNNLVEITNLSSAAALVMDGNPICFMKKEDDHWLLNLTIYDENDQPILAVRNNELMYRIVDIQDVDYKGGVFTIFRKDKICFRAAFKPPKFEILEAETWWNGIHLSVTCNGLSINGRPALNNCKAMNCSVGFIIGRDPCSLGAGARIGVPTRLIYLLGNDDPSSYPESEIKIKPWYLAVAPLYSP
jgi:trigger factor